MGTGDAAAMLLDDQDKNAVKPAQFETVRDGRRVTVVFPDGASAVAVIGQPDKMTDAAGAEAMLIE